MEPHDHEPLPPAVAPVTRRDFLFKLGLAINGLAAALVGIPVVGYVASALVKAGVARHGSLSVAWTVFLSAKPGWPPTETLSRRPGMA